VRYTWQENKCSDVSMIHKTMSSIHHIASLGGALTWREEVIDRAGRVLEARTGSGSALDAQRAWYLRLHQCRVDRRAYACRLVILEPD
jgi:hypothetical protein